MSEKPDWIINCGAYTNVEKADSEKEIAMQVNANAPMIFSEALLETGGKLLQISTDFVFDGNNLSIFLKRKEISNKCLWKK